MQLRIAMLVLLITWPCGSAVGQLAPVARPGASGWRAPSPGSSARPVPSGPIRTADAQQVVGGASPITPTAATATEPRPIRAQVSKGSSTLPNDHGQVWREYDISPYTHRITSTKQPQQAIVDWVLRETGYEAWHSTPLGLLSADKHVMQVYHTPQMQSIVAEIADRFVNSQAENHGFGLRIVTIRNPNWRARALPLMKPIPVQSPGVQGWLLAKEDAALLMSELERRTDYREHNPPHQMVKNGQSLVVSSMRPRNYTKGVLQTQNTWPGYQPDLGQLEEGFTLEFSPLLSLDTGTVDAVVKVRLAQVEKMVPVKLEVPSSVAPNQRMEVQVPQLSMVKLHERFRWPTNQVLLLSMGVVATPGPSKPNILTDNLPLPKSAPRADALLFVESKGPVAPAVPGNAATALRAERTFHGRY